MPKFTGNMPENLKSAQQPETKKRHRITHHSRLIKQDLNASLTALKGPVHDSSQLETKQLIGTQATEERLTEKN